MRSRPTRVDLRELKERHDGMTMSAVLSSVVVPIVMAVLAALLFAIAAVTQNRAVTAVVDASGRPSRPVAVGADEWKALARSGTWLAGISVNAVASVIHAGALVLAPVAIVQPIGVLSVPFAIVLAAGRSRIRPPARVLLAVVVCLASVAGFVTLADNAFGSSAAPRFAGALAAALGAGAGTALLALWGSRQVGWVRCVAFAASGATAFGLVSALMRLVALHLRSGVDDLDDVGVWLPAIGIAAALLLGGWAVQQAHAAGPPAVVVGCLTVIDPLIAVGLGVTMLGEGGSASAGAVLGLVGLAAVALSAAVLLARHYPAAVPVLRA
jgi:hypothetical protein